MLAYSKRNPHCAAQRIFSDFLFPVLTGTEALTLPSNSVRLQGEALFIQKWENGFLLSEAKALLYLRSEFR